MNKIRKWLVEIFGFSLIESKGFIMLFVTCLCIFLTSTLIRPKSTGETKPDDIETLRAFISDTKRLDKPEIKVASDKKFNPNTLSFYGWQELGLQGSLTDNIIKYRLNGGVFHEVDDLKKIYGMTEEIYSSIKSRLFIPVSNKKIYTSTKSESSEAKKPGSFEKPEKQAFISDLNNCDSADLVRIYGIGAKRASRIIEYRKKLGGFYKKEQLGEIYGMDKPAVDSLLKYSNLKSNDSLVMIRINQISFKEFLAHPYVDYNSCKILMNYRDQHKSIKSPDQLYSIHGLDSTFITKVKPYLSFD